MCLGGDRRPACLEKYRTVRCSCEDIDCVVVKCWAWGGGAIVALVRAVGYKLEFCFHYRASWDDRCSAVYFWGRQAPLIVVQEKSKMAVEWAA